MQKYLLIPKNQSLCPACFCDRGHILYSVDSEQAAQHFVLREADAERHRALKTHIEYLWQGSACDIVRCTNCEFCYADPYVGGDARFYGLAYERTGYPSRKWEYDRTLDALTDLGREGVLRGDFTLLEIGAGDGAFIKLVAPTLTPKRNAVCTEYSDYGVESIRKYGVECITEDIRSLPPRFAGRFDVICMFQVLEHLDGLEKLFDSINELTTPEAHLFIAVPNAKRIEFNELHGGLLDMPPNHVGRWNRTGFEHIARRHGWRVLKHELERDTYKKILPFLMYRYTRKRQDRDTIANRIERIRRLSIRRILRGMAKGLSIAGSVPETYLLMKTPMLGESQWVYMQKNIVSDRG